MILFALPALAAAAYYLLALVAAFQWRRERGPEVDGAAPPVSILKPVHGRDPRFYEAIRSHATQEYPEFEILFGVSNPEDPAIADIERLRGEFPGVPISLHVVTTAAPNVKAGVLGALAAAARHPVLLVNDSDIKVEPGYLRAVVAPLAGREGGAGDLPVPGRGGFGCGARRGAGDRYRVRSQRAGGAAAGAGRIRSRVDDGAAAGDAAAR